MQRCFVKIVVGEKELYPYNNIQILDFHANNVIKPILSFLIINNFINKKQYYLKLLKNFKEDIKNLMQNLKKGKRKLINIKNKNNRLKLKKRF